MKLRIKFGQQNKENISWWGELLGFPKHIDYKNTRYEWVFYDADVTGDSDYVLTYSELNGSNPDFWNDSVDWEELTGDAFKKKCECGAHNTSFAWDHLRYCSMWKPWDRI